MTMFNFRSLFTKFASPKLDTRGTQLGVAVKIGKAARPAGKVARAVAAGRATCRHGKPYHTKRGIAFLAAQESAATR